MSGPAEHITGARRYDVVRLIARGESSEILEGSVAGERALARRVAIKRLLPGADSDFVTSFMDEVRLVSQLQHANIVPMLDYGVDDGRPFLVLEYVDGLDLLAMEAAAAQVGRRLPIELALFVTSEVAHGLAYAHEAMSVDGAQLRIVHRDVSPRNVLVSFSGEVRLTDFGIAHAQEREARTRVGFVKGSADYSSPEQRQGAQVDARADLFSLGCVLHRLVAGRSPIEGVPPTQALTKVDIDAELPDDVRGIVERATSLRRQNRYSSANELASDLWRAMSGRMSNDARIAMRSFMAELRPKDARDSGERRRKPNFGLMSAPQLDVAIEATPAKARPRTIAAKEFESQDEETEGFGARGEMTRATVLATGLVPPPAPTVLASGTPAAKRAYDTTDRIRDRPQKVAPPKGSGDDPLLGTVLHGYRLVEPLGKGSYARVYRAIHEILDFQCAVKVLTEPSESAAKRLVREAKFLSTVQHENLVTVHDCGTTSDGRPWLSMELLEGRTLAEVLKLEAPLTLGRVEHLVRQIASGLASAHERGLVHRDLKPANIMLLRHHGVEWLKILDFGVARALVSEDNEALTRVNQVVGTPVYMAPEQVMRSSEVGPAADLYALGVLVYEMLTGKPPFRGGGAAKVMEAHLRSPPPPLPACGGFETLVADLLIKDPALRLASAREVIARLDALDRDAGDEWKAETTATLGGAESEPEPASAPVASRIHRTLLVGASVALLGLVAILGRALITRHSELPPAEAVIVEEAPRPVLPEGPSATAAKSPIVSPTEPAPAEPVEPEPVKRPEPSRVEPPKKALEPVRPAKSPEAVAAIKSSLDGRLGRIGLSYGDLSAIPALDAARSAFDEAVEAGDPIAAKTTSETLLEAARLEPVPLDVLERRAKRLFEELGKKSGSLSMEVYDPLEAQYLELRQSVKPGLGPTQSREILKRLSDLERKVRSAGG